MAKESRRGLKSHRLAFPRAARPGDLIRAADERVYALDHTGSLVRADREFEEKRMLAGLSARQRRKRIKELRRKTR